MDPAVRRRVAVSMARHTDVARASAGPDRRVLDQWAGCLLPTVVAPLPMAMAEVVRVAPDRMSCDSPPAMDRSASRHAERD